MTEFTVIIPARMRSTRLPEKPLKDILGKPMVVRVAQRAAQSRASDVIVACDDGRVLSACKSEGVKAVLTKTSHPTGTDRLSEAVRILNLPDDAIVVNVQGDEPLIDPEAVDRAAQLLADCPDCDIATAAHPIHSAEEFFNPNVVKVALDDFGRALLFSRAPIPWARDAFKQRMDQLPEQMPAMRHIGLYAYRVRFLKQFPTWPQSSIEKIESLEQLRAMSHGRKIAVMVLDKPLPPGVDTQEDLERVREVYRNMGL